MRTSRVIVLENMASSHATPDEAHELRDAAGHDCARHARVLSVLVPSRDDESSAGGFGRVFVEFERLDDAVAAAARLDGRFYDGRPVGVRFYPPGSFYDGELDEPGEPLATAPAAADSASTTTASTPDVTHTSTAAATATSTATSAAAAAAAATAANAELLETNDDAMDALIGDFPELAEQALLSEVDSEDESRQLELARVAKKELARVDHSAISYAPFRKALYIEVPELKALSEETVDAWRKLERVKVRGKRIPRPVRRWAQCGLSDRVLNVIERAGYAAPFAVQAQSLPVIMSGRDMIGVARTGSGKTMAYTLPLLRHAADQPPLVDGDGPIGLVMVPTRELAMQVYHEVRRFSRATGLRVAAIYGGAQVKEQIGALRRGAEIVVCTPGRMIDMLVAGQGRVTNLRRVTYLVLDEADRMFDMGFAPQIDRIVGNTRPDRQTLLFSATFPAQVEKLARGVLFKPVQVVVGGISVVSDSIEQHVLVVAADAKLRRLCEVLREYRDEGQILVFVDRQEGCDALFRELLRLQTPCATLHGGMAQDDRDSTLADFRAGNVGLLVATSVAARGLDVRDLVCVINYEPPSHYEDYVHRVGRTGRAGNSGVAYTFLLPDEDKYAPDLVRAMELAGQEPPDDVVAMANAYKAKLAAGEVAAKDLRRSGFTTGRGVAVDAAGILEEERKRKRLRAGERAAAGVGGEESGDDGGDDDDDDDDDDARAVKQRGGGGGGGGGGGEALNRRGAAASGCTHGGGAGSEEVSTATKLEAKPDAVAQAAAKALQSQLGNACAAGSEVQKRILESARAAAQLAKGCGPGCDSAAADAGAATGGGAPAAAASAGAAPPRLVAVPPIAMAPAATPAPNPRLAALPEATRRAILAAEAAAKKKAAAVAAKLQVAQAAAQHALDENTAAAAAAAAAAAPSPPPPAASDPAVATQQRHAFELEINGYPQAARYRVTNKDSLASIQEWTRASIMPRGTYYAPGRNPPQGERKLYLRIEADSVEGLKAARKEIRRILQEASVATAPDDASTNRYAKYTI